MRITIVGCGSIGSKLASAADEMPEVKRIYLVDMERHLAEDLAARLKKAIVVDSVEEELYHCDLVIEAASQAAQKREAHEPHGVEVPASCHHDAGGRADHHGGKVNPCGKGDGNKLGTERRKDLWHGDSSGFSAGRDYCCTSAVLGKKF